METYAPILLFTYNRIDTLEQTVIALKNNVLANESDLYIFSDGPKRISDKNKINLVRSYLRTINGFKKVIIYESNVNKGLANSVISGITHIINLYGKVIVVEDDLNLSPNFLTYMNCCLNKYKANDSIISVSGFTPDIIIPDNYEHDVYFMKRSTSWGWGTWKNRWENACWDIDDFPIYFKSFNSRLKFNELGFNLYSMLRKQYEGKIDSWAIRWNYHQFKRQLYSVYPVISKVNNVGFNDSATHTKRKSIQFDTKLDSGKKHNFSVPTNIVYNKKIYMNFKQHYSFTSKLKTLLIDVFKIS